MFEDKTRDVLHSEMLENISDEYDKSVGSFIYDATRPAAITIESVYQDLDAVQAKFSMDNLVGDELAERIRERTGITRKPATKATTTVIVTGQVGASINIGEQVASETVTYSFAESKTIDESGQAAVLVECDEYGSIGNVPANTIIYFPVTLEGLISVTNPEKVTNGYEAESDEELLKRYYERIQTPPTSGNKAHYKNWAMEVTGVGDAKVFPLWDGDNTVKVVIIDSNKQPADTNLINAVQEYIDPGITGTGDGVAPIGAHCTVASATALNINISFTATKDTAYTDTQIIESVENNISKYLSDIAFVEDQVSYAKIGAIILSSTGILDYSNLLVNDGTANILIGEEEVAVLGGITID